ncbi:MAG: carbonic anhydrase [Actinomycetota bacterium]|nr:carbonic anhydrase [Actinomycetota bacterium]
MPIYDADDVQAFPAEEFADVIAGNAEFASRFTGSNLSGRAAKGLAVITCMDSRVNPLGLIGMSAGDVKILRNAGARVTDDVLRTLILATYLLGVNRVLVMPHTDCRMASAPESEIHEAIDREFGVDTRSVEFRTVDNQESALITDLVRIRSHPLLPAGLVVGGAIYDVHTGRLIPKAA